MKLKDLKKSTLYQSSDLDEMEVMIAVCRNGKTQYEPLCVMGWVPLQGSEFVVLGGLTEVQRMVENGQMKKPEGYVPPSETKELIEGESFSPAHFQLFLRALSDYLYSEGWYTQSDIITRAKSYEDVESYLTEHCYSAEETKEIVTKLKAQTKQ